MPFKEKKQRNKQIYLWKEGLAKVTDKDSTKKPLTYRQLQPKILEKYGDDLSISAIVNIVTRYRKKYE